MFATLVLGLSALLVAIAPAFVPRGYELRRHTISESAGQGVRGASVARLGLALLGLGALLTAWGSHGLAAVRLLQGAFGVAMLASAVWSHRPWEPGLPFHAAEDRLHSVAASLAGVCYVGATGVAVLAAWRLQGAPAPLDLAALATALVAPPTMALVPSVAGVAQRLMFAMAYAWLVAGALG